MGLCSCLWLWKISILLTFTQERYKIKFWHQEKITNIVQVIESSDTTVWKRSCCTSLYLVAVSQPSLISSASTSVSGSAWRASPLPTSPPTSNRTVKSSASDVRLATTWLRSLEPARREYQPPTHSPHQFSSAPSLSVVLPDYRGISLVDVVLFSAHTVRKGRS